MTSPVVDSMRRHCTALALATVRIPVDIRPVVAPGTELFPGQHFPDAWFQA